MATIDQLRALLPSTLFPEIEKREQAFVVRRRTQTYLLPEIEVDRYLSSNLSCPTDTSVYEAGYYEHALQRLTALAPFLRSDEIALDTPDHSIRAIISAASTQFLLRILQRPDLPRLFYRFFMPPIMSMRHEQEADFRRAFRIQTIHLTAAQGVEHRARPAKMRALAEACLFHLAYGRGLALNLSRSWERDAYRLQRERNEQVQFPRRTYNPDLISYYQLAISSDSLMLAYLALYKIVEYFFSSVAEEGLHQRIVQRLVAPEFSHAKANQLRQLVSTVRKYDQRMDEEKMLGAVIEKYFSADEIADWVRRHETDNIAYYTTAQVVLGQTLALDLNPEQISSSLAKRIYHVRNALVHNKEGDLPRFIPFTGQEAMLSAEMPLLQFIAEQLIIRTGTDL